MENINSFEKGLHQSNSPITQPEGSYPDALNWVRNDEGRLVNEKLEEFLLNFGKDLKGFVNLDDEVILLFEDEIGVWNTSYTSIYNNPLLNIQEDVEIKARKAFNNNRIIYFVDPLNPPRYFNLDLYLRDSTKYNDLNDFNLFLEYRLPEVSNVQITTGGNLTSGSYSIVLRYRSSVDNKTFFGIPSKFYSITDDTILDDNYDGCPPDTATNKLISFTTTHIDTNYPYIEPVIITYEGLTNVLVAYSLGISSNFEGNKINFSGNSQYIERVDISEISANPLFYSTAKCIESKDNILTLSNLTTKTYDRDFQDVANNIKVRIKENFLNNSSCLRNFPYDTVSSFKSVQTSQYNNSNPSSVVDTGSNIFTTSYKNNSILKGFQKGEVYSLFITPIYKDGTLGFAYHIPANNYGNLYTEVYTSDEQYLNIQGLTGGIRHHRIPYSSVINSSDPLSSSPITTTLVLENINFSPTQQANIQGYILGFQKRDSDLNKSIIDTGIGKPYMANGNFFRQSFLNGSCKFQYEVEGQTPDMIYRPQEPALMYYSPDTQRGKKINTGYQIQKTGYARSTVNINGVMKSGVAILFTNPDVDEDPSLDVYFEQYSQIPSLESAKTITTVIDVPIVKDKTIINQKYAVQETNPYVHIESSGTIYDTFTQMQPAGNAQFIYNKIPPNKGFVIEPNPVITLVRIINDNKVQYGKLENAEYLPSKVVYDNFTTNSQEIEGDTYIFKYWFNIHDANKNNFKSDGTEITETDTNRFNMLTGVWLESQNNYELRHSDVEEVPYYPKYKTLISRTTPLGLLNIRDKGESTGYNKAYSAINDTRASFPRPVIFEEVTKYPNRTIFSELAFEGELVDQWRIFPANNFHDIPKNKGEITDTFVWNNDFYHHTERSLFKSFFNPNTTQSTSQGEVILGNAGVFRLPSIEIQTINGGYMGTTTKAGINTPFGRVFLDNHQGKVFLMSEGFSEISDLGLFSYFRGFINNNGKYALGYDYANKRLLISSYNESVKTLVNNAPVTNINYTTYTSPPVAYPIGNLTESKKYKSQVIPFLNMTVTQTYFRFNVTELETINFKLNRSNNGCKFILKFFKHIVDGGFTGSQQYLSEVTIEPNTTPQYFAKDFEVGSYYIEVSKIVQASDFELDILIETTEIVGNKPQTISYYPKTNTWTSFHDFTPKFYIQKDKELLAVKGNDLFNLNGNSHKNSNITIVSNNNPDVYKEYERMEINNMSGNTNSIGNIIKGAYTSTKDTFSTIQCWNETQNSKELPLVIPNSFAEAYEYYNDRILVDFNKNSYHLELPLDVVIDAYNNIFDNNNLDINTLFKSPFKSKFLYTKLSYNKNIPLVLSYVKTYSKEASY